MRTYDLRMARLVAEDVSHPITSFSISNDGTSLAASCLDGIVRLWDNEYGRDADDGSSNNNRSLLRRRQKRIYQKLHSHHECKNYRVECAFTSNDANVITGSECGGVGVYPVVDRHDDTRPSSGGRMTDEYDGGEYGMSAAGRRAKSSSAARSMARTLRGHTGPTCSVAACPRKSRPWLMLSSSYDGTALVWASRGHRDCCIDG
jgi:mitogen-activated protein kinase organizer 1